MHTLAARLFCSLVGATLLATAMPPLQAQDSKSAALAKELTTLLKERKLDSIAARLPTTTDLYVAALYFPGQLIVVRARSSV